MLTIMEMIRCPLIDCNDFTFPCNYVGVPPPTASELTHTIIFTAFPAISGWSLPKLCRLIIEVGHMQTAKGDLNGKRRESRCCRKPRVLTGSDSKCCSYRLISIFIHAAIKRLDVKALDGALIISIYDLIMDLLHISPFNRSPVDRTSRFSSWCR